MLATFKLWSNNRDIAQSTRQSSDKAIYTALTEIYESDFILILNSLYAKLKLNYSESTLKSYLKKTLKPFIAFLKNTKQLDGNYELPIDKIYGNQKKARSPIRTLTNDQIELVKAELDASDAIATEVLIETGMRPSELLALDALDVQSGTITINKARVNGKTRNQTKTKRDRKIAVKNKEIYTKLLKCLLEDGFSDKFVSNFNAACRKVGIAARHGSYCLRRTAITIAVSEGANLTKAGLYFGQSPSVLERHYLSTSFVTHSI
jgi:integrase